MWKHDEVFSAPSVVRADFVWIKHSNAAAVEAKGVASPQGAAGNGWKLPFMANRADRLVRRIQRQLSSVGSDGRSARPDPRDIAELGARVERLHAMDSRFIHVRLSEHIAGGAATEIAGRVRGAYVATEV